MAVETRLCCPVSTTEGFIHDVNVKNNFLLAYRLRWSTSRGDAVDLLVRRLVAGAESDGMLSCVGAVVRPLSG
jgi:hypothetical protein